MRGLRRRLRGAAPPSAKAWRAELRPSAQELAGPVPSGWRSDRAEFWARSLRWWDIAFYALWALGVAAYLLDRPRQGWGTGVALAAFAVLLAAYVGVGRRAAIAGNRLLALAYLLVMFACVCLVISTSETGTLLLFVAYSQVWYFAASRGQGVVLTVVLTVLVFATIAAQSDVRTWAQAGPLVTQAGIAIVFSVLLGLWVTQVAEQSEDRAELLARLEEAQADAAASHHAAGVLAERERMAREIHDTLAQGFTSVVMLAQSAAADLRRDAPDDAVARLGLIERTARENLAEARALVSVAAPVGLAESTLVEAVERLVARFGQETGIAVELAADPAIDHLTREREVILLRAAQEALANVRRHARATAVRLTLTVGGGPSADGDAGEHADGRDTGGGAVVRLEVVDDGLGMPPEAVEGFGLRGMRDRVASGGGALDVTSDPGHGTAVRVTLPAGRPDEGPPDGPPDGRSDDGASGGQEEATP